MRSSSAAARSRREWTRIGSRSSSRATRARCKAADGRFHAASRRELRRRARMHQPAELLAVDDDQGALEAIRATVEPLGATLTTAGSGEEALRCLLNEPDIAAILMDVGLPGMDGFETAEAIRRRQKT